MKLSDFNYNLPSELIAQVPANPRDHSRLLILDKATGAIEHRNFFDLGEYLNPGDVLVLNNSKVFPARLMGVKSETGGRIEVFLLQKIKVIKPLLTNSGSDSWQCLMSGRGCKVGLKIKFEKGLRALVIENNQDGTWRIQFNFGGEKLMKLINNIGQVPLPPYIKRSAIDNKTQKQDINSYQTVFADDKQAGSVAAPTAGLHFTKELIKKLKKQGVQFEEVTLHVGLGTFASVKTEVIAAHKMHSEWVEVKKKTLERLIMAKKEGRRVFTVGTTATRTLETVWSKMESDNNIMKAGNFNTWTDIFIYPGYKFKIVDGMITNFHVPKSTLLMLVSALAQNSAKNKQTGIKKILNAYKEAINNKYRFFSYGDAMLIKPARLRQAGG